MPDESIDDLFNEPELVLNDVAPFPLEIQEPRLKEGEPPLDDPVLTPEPPALPELPFVDDALALRAFVIRNPAVFSMRKLRDLFSKAFESSDGMLPNPIDAIEWGMGVCEKPTTAIIVAVKGNPEKEGVFRGLVIADWDIESPWSTGPWVLHFYSTGPDVVHELSSAMQDWLKEIGQTSFLGFNRTGASDAVYARFLAHRFDSEPVSTLMRLNLKE